MRDHYAAIRATGADVLGVTFETAERARDFVARGQMPFPFGLDPEYHAYTAYGLRRGGIGQLVNPRIVAQGASIVLRDPTRLGPNLDAQGRDGRQLGGDFVIAPDGVLAYAHTAVDAGDAISPKALLRLLAMVQRRYAVG